jgi:hypothetical protein
MVKNKDVRITITLECIDCAQDSEGKKKVFLDIPLEKIVIIHLFDWNFKNIAPIVIGIPSIKKLKNK